MIQTFDESQTTELTRLAEDFAGRLKEQYPDLEWTAKAYWGGQAFILMMHSPELKAALGTKGYHVSGNLEPVDRFYQFLLKPADQAVTAMERVDIGFGHEVLKSTLAQLLCPPKAAIYYSDKKPMWDIPEERWGQMYSYTHPPTRLDDVFSLSKASQILEAYHTYAKGCEPVDVLPGSMKSW